MTKLTYDCLYIVLEELENDIRTLYSCLLANRTLCEIVAPILWRNPWKFCESIYKLKRLYKTIILLLPPDSKLLLTNNDINIFDSSSPRPLFNYIAFFKSLNLINISINMVEDLTEFQEYTPNKKLLLGQEIMKMIMNYSSNLKVLSLYKCNIKEFYTFPGATKCLKNLVKLECSVNLEPSIYYGLAQICQNIKYLVVNDCIRDNDGIVALIEAQRKLQYFTYKKYDVDQLLYKKIGKALAKKAHSLISFEAYGNVAICCSIFTKLINLKILKLSVNLSNSYQQQFLLRTSSLPNLQQLNLSCHSLYITSKIIQQTSGNLQEIRVGSIGMIKDIKKENTLMFIQTITQYCPNLKLATIICYDHDDIKELKKLFSVCTKLEKLVLIHYYFNHYKNYEDKLLDIIVEYAPLSLNSLKIHYFNFSTRNLESFFEKWKMKQKTTLSFYNVSRNLYRSDLNNEFVINKYINEGIIKEFNWEEYDEY